MKPFLLIIVAACATPAGPKRPDESHRVPVNRTVPTKVEETADPNRSSSAHRQPRREGEVQWR